VEQLLARCGQRADALKSAAPGEEMERAQLGMDVCIAETVCPKQVALAIRYSTMVWSISVSCNRSPGQSNFDIGCRQAGAFMKALEKGSEDSMSSAYAAMLACNAKFRDGGEKLFKA